MMIFYTCVKLHVFLLDHCSLFLGQFTIAFIRKRSFDTRLFFVIHFHLIIFFDLKFKNNMFLHFSLDIQLYLLDELLLAVDVDLFLVVEGFELDVVEPQDLVLL